MIDAKTGNSVRVPYWLDNAGDNGAGAVVISTDLQVKEVRYAWERFPQCLVRLFFLIYVWAISLLTSNVSFSFHSCITASVVRGVHGRHARGALVLRRGERGALPRA